MHSLLSPLSLILEMKGPKKKIATPRDICLIQTSIYGYVCHSLNVPGTDILRQNIMGPLALFIRGFYIWFRTQSRQITLYLKFPGNILTSLSPESPPQRRVPRAELSSRG